MTARLHPIVERSGVAADPVWAIHLPELIDAAGSCEELDAALPRMAAWWRARAAVRQVLIGVVDQLRRQSVIGLAGVDIEPRASREEICALKTDVSGGAQLPDAGNLRGRFCRLAGCSAPESWVPLVEGGRCIGGIALWARAPSSVPILPTLGVELTTRLAAQVRDRSERLWRAKLESLAEFAAGAGHEINNPLGTILGRAQRLAAEETAPERRRTLATIAAQALRVRDMIGDAMLFARPPVPRPESVRLAEICAQVASRFSPDAAARGIRLEITVPAALTIWADPTQAAVVLSELLRNAVEHSRSQPTEPPATVTIRASIVAGGSDGGSSSGTGRWVELTVEDRGPGLSDVDREHLFDPFYSGRSAGRGLGFGLSKCWRIVAQHGGCLHVGDAAGPTAPGPSALGPATFGPSAAGSSIDTAVDCQRGVRATIHWPVGPEAERSAGRHADDVGAVDSVDPCFCSAESTSVGGQATPIDSWETEEQGGCCLQNRAFAGGLSGKTG